MAKSLSFLLFVVSIFIVSCTPSESSIDTVIPQTRAVNPTNTLNPIDTRESTFTHIATGYPTNTPKPTPTPTIYPPPTELRAFPGAEGFGAITPGGRGGQVYEVTNLHDSGAGSFRACAEASEPRICVFRVAGTITLHSNIDITSPYITIAGQTAPGGGITLKFADSNSTVHLHVETHDVIIRYIRLRPGTNTENGRALTVSKRSNPPYNVIVDHVSMSWSGDEMFITWYDTNNITVQWSIMAESLPAGDGGYKGPNLGEGGASGYLKFAS